MPEQIRAVVVDPAVPGKLAIKSVELRDPDRDEVAVRVTAISLNRGETRRNPGQTRNCAGQSHRGNAGQSRRVNPGKSCRVNPGESCGTDGGETRLQAGRKGEA